MDAQAGLLVVKILERRALLLGLDSPQKLDVVQVQAQETPPRHERIREAIMRLTGRDGQQPSDDLNDDLNGDGNGGDGADGTKPTH